MEFWIGWKYFRIDYQRPSEGWRLWLYSVQYDGWHYALHMGPVVLGYGDGVPPSVLNKTPQKDDGSGE